MAPRQDHLAISLLAGVFPPASWLTVALLHHSLSFLLVLSSVGLSLLFGRQAQFLHHSAILT